MSSDFSNTMHSSLHRGPHITSISHGSPQDDSVDKRIDLRVAGRTPTTPELEACRNAVRHSIHSSIQVLPNHSLDRVGRLQGFCFQCSDEDKASVLPIHEHCFEMTAVYEVQRHSKGFDAQALKIIANIDASRQLLHELARELTVHNTLPATFDCIPTTAGANGAHQNILDPYSINVIQDQKAWTESPPFKMGIYHTFTRAGSRSTDRGHRVYIVVSGCLRHAAEQLYNLWQDCQDHITCRQFCEAQEVSWLRSTTVRNLNRIAHRIASRFDLSIHEMIDTEDPTNNKLTAIPSLVSAHHDIISDAGKTYVVNSACFTERSGSGIVFDLFSSEGYWIYLGPTDNADYSQFGSMISATSEFCAFPTRTVCYNLHYPVLSRANVVNVDFQDTPEVVSESDQSLDFWLPDEEFQSISEKLGFNRNNGILPLVPIICFDNTAHAHTS